MFQTIRIALKKDRKSWYIAGYRFDGSFKLLGVLDEPVTLEMVRSIAHYLATEFQATDIEEETYPEPSH